MKRAAFLALLFAAPAALAQQAGQPPRTPDRHPDFQGSWITPWTTTLERDAGFKTLVISA